MTPCALCPKSDSCHYPYRPAMECREQLKFWSLETRTEWEGLQGNQYPPKVAIDYTREQIDAARRLLESKGYRVVMA